MIPFLRILIRMRKKSKAGRREFTGSLQVGPGPHLQTTVPAAPAGRSGSLQHAADVLHGTVHGAAHALHGLAGGGRAGGARAGGACGTAGPAARVPAPCRGFPRGRLPHAEARKKRGALRLPRKCDQILIPSSAILSRSERKSAKPFWVLAGLRSSAAGWKVPIIQTPFFSTHSPCWRVTL